MRVVSPIEGIISDRETIETRIGFLKHTNNLRKGTNVLIYYDYCNNTIKSVLEEDDDDEVLVDGRVCVCLP